MNLELAGKTVLISGSSKGIGKAIAAAFYKEGCNVVLNGRDGGQLESVLNELGERASIFAADVTQPEDCAALVAHVIERWGRLDILVCNVGSGSSVPPGSETLAEWRRVFDLNLFSATNMVEAAAGALAETQGNAVCISSICGQQVIPGAPVTYSAAKAALNAFVRGIARPLGREGVRINAVAPGNILFEGSVWQRKLAEGAMLVQQFLEKDVPLRRLGQPEEIAGLVVFLASARAGFSTGGVFVTDGGQVVG
ncbi:MAG: SDR family NAD(P)-dependent oxidoreductase [Sulfuricella sp.]|nr:SDR family NAD(P)-dependent oxidoreductase [Sulfuricella sp.]